MARLHKPLLAVILALLAAGAAAWAPAALAASDRAPGAHAQPLRFEPTLALIAASGASAADQPADRQCPAPETIYAIIARTTQGAAIGDIIAALSEVAADPQGQATTAPLPLAQQLRAALELGAATPCGAVSPAVAEALRLARLADAGSSDDATAAIAPDTATPLADIPTGTPGGAGGSGYN